MECGPGWHGQYPWEWERGDAPDAHIAKTVVHWYKWEFGVHVRFPTEKEVWTEYYNLQYDHLHDVEWMFRAVCDNNEKLEFLSLLMYRHFTNGNWKEKWHISEEDWQSVLKSRKKREKTP